MAAADAGTPAEQAASRSNIIDVTYKHGHKVDKDGDVLFTLRLYSLVRDAPGIFIKLSRLVVDAATARKLEFERIDLYSDDGHALPTEDILIGTLVNEAGHVTALVVPRGAASRQTPLTPAPLCDVERLTPPRPRKAQPAKQAKLCFEKQTATQAAAVTMANMLYDAQIRVRVGDRTGHSKCRCYACPCPLL